MNYNLNFETYGAVLNRPARPPEENLSDNAEQYSSQQERKEQIAEKNQNELEMPLSKGNPLQTIVKNKASLASNAFNKAREGWLLESKEKGLSYGAHNIFMEQKHAQWVDSLPMGDPEIFEGWKKLHSGRLNMNG